MKKINGLTVSVNFSVGFNEVEVSDSVFNGLLKIEEMSSGIQDTDYNKDKDVMEAFEWLNNRISMDDSLTWGYEIDELDED